VLMIALRQFLPFMVIDIVTGLVINLAASLLLFPGMFIFARSWLAAPAFAADPAGGIGAALRRGWTLSRGLTWLALLGIVLSVILAGIFFFLLASTGLVVLVQLVGMGLRTADDAGFFVMAGMFAVGQTLLTLIRVASYRRLMQGRMQGM
jgi:hypothetical protein